MANTKRHKWEHRLLDRLAHPDEIKHGWSDIELEDDMKHAIIQIADLASSDPSSQTGFLRHSHINGALLYGPPSTDKTQLARVLAHEYRATMIHISAAELVSKWAGESKKTTKGLSNLAVMAASSIIFVDDADSLKMENRQSLMDD